VLAFTIAFKTTKTLQLILYDNTYFQN